MALRDNSIVVLHVDDDPSFAELTAAVLEEHYDQFEVMTETSARAAIECIQHETVDCVVADYDMPGMDGIEFCKALRKADHQQPFILFTGKESKAVAEEVLAAGGTDYLQKGAGTDRFLLLANCIKSAVERVDAEQNYQAVFENSAVGIVVIDPETHTIIDTNERFGEIVASTPAEIIGSHPARFTPDDSRLSEARASQHMEDVQVNGARTFEWLYNGPEGKSVWLEVTVEPTTMNGQQCLLGVFRDMYGETATQEYGATSSIP